MSILRRWLSKILSFMVLIVLSETLYAQEISVLTENWAPYNYKDKSGNIVGYSTEVVKEVFKRAGLKYKISMYPWKRAVMNVDTNKDTMIYTIARTQKRESQYKWIGPIAPRKLNVYKMKIRDDIKVTQVEDLKKYGQTLGLMRGDASLEYFQENGFDDRHYQIVTDTKLNINKFFLGRIWFIVSNDLTLAYLCKIHGYDCEKIERVLTIIDRGGYYLAFNKDSSDILVNQLQKAFDEIKNDGTLEKIKRSQLN